MVQFWQEEVVLFKKCHAKNVPKPPKEKYGLMVKTRSLYA
jgi:hypothetical protein